MKKITVSSILHNLGQNVWLLGSAAAALCLFLSSSKLSLLLVAGVFVLVFAASALFVIRPAALSSRGLRVTGVLAACILALMGCNTFRISLRSSTILAALAERIGLPPMIVLLSLAAVGAIVGFYAIYVLASHFVQWGDETLHTHTPRLQKSQALANLKKNWYLPLSAMAFFCLTADVTLGYIIGWFVAVGLVMIFTSHIPSVWDTVRQ